MPQTIVITGASSGIGRALACHYAKPGVTLCLIGRNEERLEAVRAACESQGADLVRAAALDVRDREALFAALQEFDKAHPVDLLIANAGVTGGTTPEGDFEPIETSHMLMETNVLGVFNSIHALLPQMLIRGRGQIALIGSLAGFVPMGDSPSYCASKAAILSYGLSLREGLRNRGVNVNVVCPGFIETPLSDKLRSAKPQLMTAEKAAVAIAKGIEKNRGVVAFPFALSFVTRLGQFLPAFVRRAVIPSFSIHS